MGDFNANYSAPPEPEVIGMMTDTLDRIESSLLNLVKSSATHEEWLKSIDHRLGVLNGSVSKHEEKLGELRQFVTEHPLTCELRKNAEDAIASIRQEWEVKKHEYDAAGKERDRWIHRLSPKNVAPWALLFVLAVLIIVHNGQSVVSAIEHFLGL